jgi:predicted amino acid racemase
MCEFTPVIKSIAGDLQIVQKLIELGITHFADSRLENIRQLTNSIRFSSIIVFNSV